MEWKVVDRQMFSTFPFNIGILRKQWLEDKYHSSSFRVNIGKWEKYEKCDHVQSNLEKIVLGRIPTNPKFDFECCVIIKPKYSTSFLEVKNRFPQKTNPSCRHQKQDYK